jgi:hypothetical protein
MGTKTIKNGHQIVEMGTKSMKWAPNRLIGYQIIKIGTKSLKWVPNWFNKDQDKPNHRNHTKQLIRHQIDYFWPLKWAPNQKTWSTMTVYQYYFDLYKVRQFLIIKKLRDLFYLCSAKFLWTTFTIILKIPLNLSGILSKIRNSSGAA